MGSSPGSGAFQLCAVGHLLPLSDPSFLIFVRGHHTTSLAHGHPEHHWRRRVQKAQPREGSSASHTPPRPRPPQRFLPSPSGALSTVYQSLKRAECSFLSSSSSGRSRMSFSVCGGQGPAVSRDGSSSHPLGATHLAALAGEGPGGAEPDSQKLPETPAPLCPPRRRSGSKLQTRRSLQTASAEGAQRCGRRAPCKRERGQRANEAGHTQPQSRDGPS